MFHVPHQVAMIMVYRSEHNGDVPKFAYGLQNTLFEQLGLSPDEVYVERMREQYLEVCWRFPTLGGLDLTILDCFLWTCL